MAPGFIGSARKVGRWSAAGTVFFSVAYLIPLVAGLLSLKSSDEPIGDPWFSMLEILIILTTPVMVALMVAVHAWAPAEKKVFGVLAIVFMSLVALLTCSLHFVILTVSHQPVFADLPSMDLFFSFKWPSVAYAFDILAWDLFFPLSVLSAAPVFGGSHRATSIRNLLIASGLLALGGLAGAVLNDMQLRNIGIVGYAVVFPVAALFMFRLFDHSFGEPSGQSRIDPPRKQP